MKIEGTMTGSARTRYHMESRDHKFFVEGKYHDTGLRCLKEIRSKDPRFKRMRIKSVIQCLPSQVELYEIIERKY